MVDSIVRTGALAAALLTCQLAGLLAFLAAATDGSSAQTFPTQLIRIIVATPPVGIADLVGRTFAQKLSESGKAAFVENRTGAGDAIAAEAAAKATARWLYPVRQHWPEQYGAFIAAEYKRWGETFAASAFASTRTINC